ncbi:MAG: hypothetical protein LBU32_10610 [Clostridiales bacterium]|jgi:hypothetical protein|nr:hypothetical protein [Clostridiales bacterium]
MPFEDANINNTYVFTASLKISDENAPARASLGRRRRSVEENGFRAQKRKGFCMARQFPKDCGCQKIHCLLKQIAHSNFQMLEKGSEAFESGNATHSRIRRPILAGFSEGSALENMQCIISSQAKYEFINRDPRQRAGHEKDGAFNPAS